jgi:hypothetical protein
MFSLLCNPKVCYNTVYKCQPLVHIASQMNPIHFLKIQPYFLLNWRVNIVIVITIITIIIVLGYL